MITPTRRTQAERRADTTAKLLEATADALVELGYAGATTPEICRRAGVSRGAMLHHYPTKDELVAAAVAHVVDRRVEEFRATLGALPDGVPLVEQLETAIDVLWGLYRGELTAAWIELVVAARTDPQLRRHVTAVEEVFAARTKEAWADLFPESGALPDGFYDTAPPFFFAVLDGLVLHLMVGSPGAELQAEMVLLTVKVIVRMFAEADPDQTQRHLDALLEELQ